VDRIVFAAEGAAGIVAAFLGGAEFAVEAAEEINQPGVIFQVRFGGVGAVEFGEKHLGEASGGGLEADFRKLRGVIAAEEAEEKDESEGRNGGSGSGELRLTIEISEWRLTFGCIGSMSNLYLICAFAIAAFLIAWIVNGLVGLMSGEKPEDLGSVWADVFLRLFTILELGAIGRFLQYCGISSRMRRLVFFVGWLCLLMFFVRAAKRDALQNGVGKSHPCRAKHRTKT